MRMYSHAELVDLVTRATDESEAQLFYEIKSEAGPRTSLLAQLDALQLVKDRIHANIGHPPASNA